MKPVYDLRQGKRKEIGAIFASNLICFYPGEELFLWQIKMLFGNIKFDVIEQMSLMDGTARVRRLMVTDWSQDDEPNAASARPEAEIRA